MHQERIHLACEHTNDCDEVQDAVVPKCLPPHTKLVAFSMMGKFYMVPASCMIG